MIACGVDVDGSMKDFNYFGGIYPPQENWAIYYIQGYHDQFLHRVQLSELAPYLSKIENEWKDKSKIGDLVPAVAKVAQSWTREGDDEREVRRLLALLRESRLESAKEDDAERLARLLDDEEEFFQRWRRFKRYWATALFEFCWLSLVLIVAAIPWIRQSGRLAWATHLGLALPLLFLPFFLGYVPYTFTSAFPAGGILYPYLVACFSGLPLFDLDIWYYKHAPQPFEPLTQEPGPMLAITGMGVVGPIAICALGVAVFVSVYVTAFTGKFLASKFRR